MYLAVVLAGGQLSCCLAASDSFSSSLVAAGSEEMAKQQGAGVRYIAQVGLPLGGDVGY
jgi:hypothetical protein